MCCNDQLNYYRAQEMKRARERLKELAEYVSIPPEVAQAVQRISEDERWQGHFEDDERSLCLEFARQFLILESKKGASLDDETSRLIRMFSAGRLGRQSDGNG